MALDYNYTLNCKVAKIRDRSTVGKNVVKWL